MTLSTEIALSSSQPTLADAAAAANAFAQRLSAEYLERDSEIRGLLLATIAREHVLLLGPPGTAKSALTNAFSRALGWTTFVRLLSRTTTPDEIFGPLDLSGLDEKPSRFERVLTGYIAACELAFLDECFKANSAILNALLTLINERCYDNGTARIGVPLEVVVGASNEYPADESLAALYDRFLLRYWVRPLQHDASFEAMLLGAGGGLPPARFDRANVAVLRAAADSCDVRPVIKLITTIKHELLDQLGMEISDRRWRRSLGLIRAAAVLDGRTVAAPRDLSVLSDVLWERHDQRSAIEAIVFKHSRSAASQRADLLRKAGREICTGVPNWSTARSAQIAEWNPRAMQLGDMIDECDQLLTDEPGNSDVIAVRSELVAAQTAIVDGIQQIMTRNRRV